MLQKQSASNPPETTALASFSGSGVEKSIFREVFSGSLFSVGGGVEKVTFDYNLSSINLFTTEDRDLVTNSASVNEDFGSTTEGIPQGAVDFDHIVFTQDAYGTTGGLTWSLTRDGWTQTEIDDKLFINPDYVTPETGLVPIAGVEQTQEESGDVKFIPIFGQFGQGSLFAVGGAAETAISEERQKEFSSNLLLPTLSMSLHLVLMELHSKLVVLERIYRWIQYWTTSLVVVIN